MDTECLAQLLHKYDYESKSLPPLLALNAKRNHLLLSYKYSAHVNPEWIASQELEVQLAEYSQLVDDRKGVNNFAAATLELCSKLRKDCKGWKSSLNTARPFRLEHQACSNSSEDGCTADLPTDEALANFRDFKPQFDQHDVLRVERDQKFGSYSDAPSFGNAVPPNATPLAAHFPSRQVNPPKQSTSLSHQPLNDGRSSGFVAKRPQSSASSFGVDRDGINPYRSNSGGAPRNFSEDRNEGFTEYPTGGGIYTSRVGGRFKKWGGQEKSDVNKENSDNADYGYNGAKSSIHSGHPNEDVTPTAALSSFKTAGQQLKIDMQKKHGGYGSHSGNSMDSSRGGYGNSSLYNGRTGNGSFQGNSSFGGASRDSYGNSSFGGGSNSGSSNGGGLGGYGNNRYHPIRSIKKSLGGKGLVNNKFVPPMRNNIENRDEPNALNPPEEEVDERLKNIEPRMIELIKNEIMDCGSKITWDDIAGLHFAKNTIQEIVVWPMLRPDIFTGLRRPPKGILLFGPPGTGKTLIGKCIASQSGSTFFSISASSLTSKWIGEGEKMVRALFAVARVHQPAVVFIDEIDSLLSQRSETEHESSRRIKTEFLVQLDGAGTDEEDRLLVIGATNRPQELDEAARRRLVKRLYIPLPEQDARKEMIVQLMKCERNDLTEPEIDELSLSTDGFSGADMKHLCQEACLGPIRSLGPSQISSIAANQVRPVNMADFTSALKRVHPSVGQEDLHQYVTWNKTYGSGS